MTQQERDMMVERYTDGSMSQSERQEFLALLDRDEGMRRTLDAENLINSAVKVDRTATAMPSAASRERFLTMLATVAPETAAPSAGSGSGEGSGIAGKGAMGAKGIAGSGAVKAIVSTLAGLAVTVGAIVFVPKLIESPAPKGVSPAAVAPAPQQTAAAPSQDATGATTPSTTTAPRAESVAPSARKRTASAESERNGGEKSARKSGITKGENSEGAKEDPRLVNGETPTKMNIKPPVIKR